MKEVFKSSVKPSLGQHWLNDKASLQKMVEAADLGPKDTVLEIGTGLGYLTDELIKTKASVISLEYDSNLYKRNLVKYNLQKNSNLKLVEADVRKFDWRTLKTPYKICANIPYYLSANLLRSLIETPAKPSLAVLLLDQAVALKLSQDRKRSLLTTLLQSHYGVNLAQTVGRELFHPPPKVTSQITILKHQSAFLECNQEQWQLLVRLFKVSFSSQRKQIGVNLRHGLNLSKKELTEIFKDLDISAQIRAEEISNQQWWQLFLKIQHKL